jgi:hypothetical protein
MDITTLTDDELDALLLAVQAEQDRRYDVYEEARLAAEYDGAHTLVG